jgi:ParB family chromosome partitioning protein
MGRSMAAILGDHQHAVFLDQGSQIKEESVREIAIAQIEPNPYQPRQVFDPAEIQSLADSIREQGLLTPILVRQHGSKFQIIAGERRFRATQLLGATSIKAGVFDTLTDQKMMEWALIENIQRVQLSPIEEAQAYEQLLAHHGYTHEALAQTLGKSRSAVSNTLRLLKLPESVQAWIRSGDLSAGHARNLLRSEVKDPEKLAREWMEQGASVRDAERVSAKPPKPAKPIDPNLRALEDEFRYATGSEVRITPGVKGGAIEIRYADNQDLMRLLDQFQQGQRQTWSEE